MKFDSEAKNSLVITVLNESETITNLLDSLLMQSKLPDEIIIVDGGSADDTIDLINKYVSRFKNLKIIRSKGNISHGRNIGIQKATHEIIVLTDAGCVVHKDWFEKITDPFSHSKVDVAAGYYKMLTKNSFSQAAAPFFGITANKFDVKNYLPSARSMAFRKKVWETIGGFDESLALAGEDTLFNYQVVKNDFEIKRIPDALVDWTVPSNVKSVAKKFFLYAKGDAEANIWWHPVQGLHTHNLKIASIFLRYFSFLLVFLMGYLAPIFSFIFIQVFLFYLFWSVWKMRFEILDTKTRAFIPIIQLISDFSIMLGFASGYISKL